MENSVYGKTFDMNKTLIYLLSVGNNLIKSLDTQGKEGIEKVSNTVGSESGGKEVTRARDKVCRVANRIQGVHGQRFPISLCRLSHLS